MRNHSVWSESPNTPFSINLQIAYLSDLWFLIKTKQNTNEPERADIAGVHGAGSRIGVRPPSLWIWLVEGEPLLFSICSPAALLARTSLYSNCSGEYVLVCVFQNNLSLALPHSLTYYSWTFPNVVKEHFWNMDTESGGFLVDTLLMWVVKLSFLYLKTL